MTYFYAFLICGTICAVGQILYEYTKMSAGHITSLFVSLGCILEFFGIYDKLIDLAGMGASLPITNFGYLLMKASLLGLEKEGLIGVGKNMLSLTSGGITTAILLSFVCSIIFKSKY